MGSKKRSSTSMEAAADAVADDGGFSNLKKSKKGKTKQETTEASAPSSSTAPTAVKPMERQKKRKALDKVRRLHTEETKPKEPKTMEVPASSSTSGVLPEFHVGVFKDLSSADGSVREAAAEALAMELVAVQRAYDGLENKELVEGGVKLDAEKDDGLNDCAPSLRYAVRRLIRGVSSSRECARQGFALGLSILVSTIPSIKVNSLLKLIVDFLEVSSSMKGQEQRDHLLGRLFAYGAIARSGRLAEEWVSDRNTPLIKEFTSLLIALASKKRYLQEPVVSVIVDLIEKLHSEALLNHILEAPGLNEWFEGAIQIGNPDALLLALKIREKTLIESSSFGNLLPVPFSPDKLFSADHLSSLANCLKESTFGQPRVHNVWPVLVNMLLPDRVLQAEDAISVSNSLKRPKKNRKSSSSDEEIAKNFQCFCEVIIEGSLLTSSHDRKHLAFDVLLLLLPKLPASFISITLSYKIVQCMIDILSTKDSWLYKVVQHFLKTLTVWVGDDDVRRVSVIVALQKHSNGKFDGITRTKTVKDLMSDFRTESGCMLFIQNLLNMFLDEKHTTEEPSDQSQTTDDNSDIGSVEDKDSVGTMGNSDFLKTWIVESLPSILKNLKLDPEAKFRVQKGILKFLAVQGLFTASLGSEVTSLELQETFRWPKTAVSSALCRMCIEQLQLLFANSQKGEGSGPLLNCVEQSDLGSYFMRFLSTLCSIPSVSYFRPLETEEENTLKKLQAMETSLSKEERNCQLTSDANRLHALRYLLIQLLLQMLLRPKEYLEAVSELMICCKKAFPVADLLDSPGEDDLDDEGAPAMMDVLVDTLLSLLPQSSAPMRTAIEQVFKCFCDDITDDGLLRMLRVIRKNLKPARHQDADSDDIFDDEEDDEDFLNIEEDEGIDKAETGETGDSDEQPDDSEADSEAADAVEAVGKENPEASDDSDGGMDDDAMFRMDTYLTQIFKERKNLAGGDTAHHQLMLFKLRVLSLLEIYLHENPGKPQVLLVYSNLARAFIEPPSAESSEQLGQRVWGIMQKKIFKAKDYPKGEDVQLSTLESLLQKNLKLASKPIKRKKSATNLSKKKQSASWNRHKMITSLAQSSTFWILKIVEARNFPESELQRIFDIFQGVLVEYFNSKKSQIKSGFLKEIFRRRPWVGHHLFGFLLEKCGTSKSDFRRVEALDLVSEILKSLGSTDGSSQEALKNIMKSHLPKLCRLIEQLLTNISEKQSRQAEARKFCSRILQMITTLKLTKSFLKKLSPDAHAKCESQLSAQFIKMKTVPHE
ncbi:rDNA transcriptional regulator pol5-like [Malus sylvestris]|uniref:rDNA transcriptional regulator pol5-like n=1 Tax=Malus sylvestris TaxID=3752 RepID=UPI0021ABCCE3|nr:rDNA transcriptional regulator pol5-like [Malus sylvestris]XP_050146463.1 rDNA transcriptional regulator pol5-like [Malus sylvestris]